MVISRRAFLLMPVANSVRTYSASQDVSELERCVVEQKSYGKTRNSTWNIYVIRMIMVIKGSNDLYEKLLSVHKFPYLTSVDVHKLTGELDLKIKGLIKAFKDYRESI